MAVVLFLEMGRAALVQYGVTQKKIKKVIQMHQMNSFTPGVKKTYNCCISVTSTQSQFCRESVHGRILKIYINESYGEGGKEHSVD